LMQKATSGTSPEDLLYQSTDRVAPTSWSRDGRFVAYVIVDPRTNSDVWTLSLDGGSKPVPFLHSDAAESQAPFAPDRHGAPRWVAYPPNEAGRDEVELRTFPDGQNRLIVSRGGGHSPRWRGDGRELFYIAADGTVMAVAIADNPLRIAAE